MTTAQLWWVKRSGEPKGPFPTAVLENNIRQGRVRGDDQLSLDGQSWHPALEVPQFASLWSAEPTELAGGVDERSGERREEVGDGSARSGEDRRVPEDPILVARRERANRVWSGLRQHPARPNPVPFIILAVLVLGVFLLSTQGTRLGADDARCSAPAAPEVNWEYCNLVTRDLRGQDLSRANLRNARLLGVDLSGAKLERADLAYADLTGAVLRETNLGGARLVGTRLNAAQVADSLFSDADLSYADFSQAVTSSNRFQGARFADTLLPTAQPCTDEAGKTACAALMERQTR